MESMNPRQRARHKLRRQDTVIGVNPEFASSGLAEFIARRGVDLIFIDCEHGGPGIETVADMARAVRYGGAASLLRPWSKDPGLLRRYISSGIDGLIAPQVETAAEVRALVQVIDDCSPEGREDFILVALIESQTGCDNVDEILATDLIDAVLVGCGDLAVSLGLPRKGNHPLVRELTVDVLRRARSAGVSAWAPLKRFGMAPAADADGKLTMLFLKDLLGERLDSERAHAIGSDT